LKNIIRYIMDKEILLKELKFSFSRAAGSGGQHVNKVSTKVELHFDLKTSKGLDAQEKGKVSDALSNRVNIDGKLKIQVGTTRSQLKNRQLATKKFLILISEALLPKKKRKKTKPSKEMNEKRLKKKKQQSEKKNYRKKVKMHKRFDLFSFNCVPL